MFVFEVEALGSKRAKGGHILIMVEFLCLRLRLGFKRVDAIF